MFGMLDYRAHKLYLILFGPIWFFIKWASVIGFPFMYYSIGLAIFDNRILQIGISLLSLVVIELIWAILHTYIDSFFMFLFQLLVDVIPYDGRTREESILVVKGGEAAIAHIAVNKKHPSEWTDEDCLIFQRGFFNWFFQDVVNARIELIRSHYRENPGQGFSEWAVEDLLKKNNLSVSLYQKVITNPSYRLAAISYAITFYLLIFHPFK